MELRVIAELSGDKRLTKRLLKGVDIHGELAEQIYGSSYKPDERNKCKIGLFAMLYGATNKAISRQVGCTVVQAEGIRKAWRELYPTTARASDQWTEEALATGQTILPGGIWVANVGRTEYGEIAGYKAINYQIQGMAAFIFRQAVAQLVEAGFWHYIRMVVHDEFVLCLPHPAEHYLDLITKCAIVQRPTMRYDTEGTLYDKYWGEV